MKFDFIIGNPPYQEEQEGDNKTFAPPIYHKFLEEAYKLSDCVEMVHPARFLFNAGSTPKEWNRKMLSDPHLKVLFYEQDSSKVFPNTDIKGGVAITYRDKNKDFGIIDTFVAFDELRTIMQKVRIYSGAASFSDIVLTAYSYRFTDKMHEEHPYAREILSVGHDYDLKSNVFEKLPDIFLDSNPDEVGDKYIKILGREKNDRTYKWIKKEYIGETVDLNKWKVFVPAANGSGALGEVIATPLIGQPLIGQPLIGHTEAFMSIGPVDSKEEAESILKYIKTKFARCLLGILKITQHNPPEKWKYIPMQDFTETSDIDWSKSISEVDEQIYKKYGLSNQEIEFIESHVKEME